MIIILALENIFFATCRESEGSNCYLASLKIFQFSFYKESEQSH